MRVVKFRKEGKRWYVRYVASAYRDEVWPEDWTWRFSDYTAAQAILTLKNVYGLSATVKKIGPDCNIYLSFKDEADEAAFILMASGETIKIDVSYT